MEKILVEVYSKRDCCLCDEVTAVLQKVQKDLPFEIVEVDITRDSQLFEEFKEQIPVVFINGQKSFKYKIGERELRKKLRRYLC